MRGQLASKHLGIGIVGICGVAASAHVVHLLTLSKLLGMRDWVGRLVA